MTWRRGITYIHEHVTIDLSGVKVDADARLDSMSEAIAELKHLRQLGVSNLVDVTARGMGRNVRYVNKVAKATGIRVIVSTGYYKEPYFPPEVYALTEAELAAIMVREIVEGVEEGTTHPALRAPLSRGDFIQAESQQWCDGAYCIETAGDADIRIKAGIIGEIGTGQYGMNPAEEKVFRAAALAHRETGAPIATHTTLGLFGMEQIALFRQMGVDLGKVMIGHVDLSGDADYVLRLLDTGVFVGFDTIGKVNYQPEATRLEMLKAICARGYSRQVMLSMDITRKSHLEANGGPGYRYLLDTFVPYLLENGLTRQDIDRMLIDNAGELFGVKT